MDLFLFLIKNLRRQRCPIVLMTLMLFAFPSRSMAGQVSITTYYPTPVGVFDHIAMIPQSTFTQPCAIGTFMADQLSSRLFYCHDNGSGQGIWGALGDEWGNIDNYVYPLATDSQPNIFMGIGTSTPTLKLTLENDGGILALGNLGSGVTLSNFSGLNYRNFLWYPKRAAFRVGGQGTYNDSSIGDYSIGLGYNTNASGLASNIIGGTNNIAQGQYSSILGGSTNTITTPGNFSIIAGGTNNLISEAYSTVIGSSNVATGTLNSIAGGACNFTKNPGASIAGGTDNNSQRDVSNVSQCLALATIGQYSNISGGKLNHAFGNYSTIAGGYSNSAGGNYSTIAGSEKNLVDGNYATIASGANSRATSDWSVLAGAGGFNGDTGLAVLGTNRYATVIGNGQLVGPYSVIASSRTQNTTGGAVYATTNHNVITGYLTGANGQYSWVGGHRMRNTGNRSFLWGSTTAADTVSVPVSDAFVIYSGKMGVRHTNPVALLEIRGDSSEDYFAITSSNTAVPGDIFIVKANGRVGIGNADPQYPLQIGNIAGAGYLSAAGTWQIPSSREFKDHIEPLTLKESLATLKKLNPKTYTYKLNPREHHVGFIAEEVPALVIAGRRESVDTMSVLATLTTVVKEHKNELQKREEVLNDIDRRLQDLEEKIKQ